MQNPLQIREMLLRQQRGSHPWCFPWSCSESCREAPPSLGQPRRLCLIFLYLLPGLKLCVREGGAGCASPGLQPPGTGAVPRDRVALTRSISCPVPRAGRAPAAGADGKSGRGTARSFPAFGLGLLRGEGGTGRAGLGGGAEPLLPPEGLFLGTHCAGHGELTAESPLVGMGLGC